MDTPNPDTQSRLVAEIEARRRALLQLRVQMMQLHARLEYLRLMIRLSPRGPQGCAPPGLRRSKKAHEQPL